LWYYQVLKLIKVSLGAGVRPLTEDEHLYIGDMHLLFEVFWIEHCTSSVNECPVMLCYCCSSSMSIMSFLMHPWYSSYAYTCNRCAGRSDPVGVQGIVPGGAAIANTGGSGGTTHRRGARQGHHWLPWPCSLQFRKRQAPEHYKPPNF
jgi:hypothetical protein